MFNALLIGLALTGQVTNDFPNVGPVPTTMVVHMGPYTPEGCTITYNPATKQWTGAAQLQGVASSFGIVRSTPIFLTLQGSTTSNRWGMTKGFCFWNGKPIEGATTSDTPNAIFPFIPSHNVPNPDGTSTTVPNRVTPQPPDQEGGFNPNARTSWTIIGNGFVIMPGGL